VVTVRGELDIATRDELSSTLHIAMGQLRTGEPLVVDLGDVTFMDCAGMRPLMQARQRLGRSLWVQAVPLRIASMFHLAQVHDHLLGHDFHCRSCLGLDSDVDVAPGAGELMVSIGNPDPP
jgi:anti-anti-sigma factor